jgi:hypothetical protein
MARISAGVGTSHVPAIGVALDLGKSGEPYWQPIFAGYEPTKAWIARQKPGVIILVYNDHASAAPPNTRPPTRGGARAPRLRSRATQSWRGIWLSHHPR